MRKLVLVRHSLPEIAPDVPACQWHLSDEGRRRCELLASQLGEYDPAIVVTSLEPKAIETGQIVADRLGKPLVRAPDLHEHERGRVNVFPSRETFEARLADLFACPRSLVFGSETADQARARFAKAVADVTARYPGGDLIVVSHGTVIALFVAHVAGLEPFLFWKRLGLPCFVVLSLPGLDLLEVIEGLDDSLA